MAKWLLCAIFTTPPLYACRYVVGDESCAAMLEVVVCFFDVEVREGPAALFADTCSLE